MSFLFIGSTGDHAGHSLVTWAIARRLLEKGRKVGFLKPFGTCPIYKEGSWTDHDAVLFKEVLNLREPYDLICPYPVSEAWRQKGSDEILVEVKSLSKEVSRGKDILLIMGSKHIFFDDTSCPVPDMALINALNSDFVLITRYRKTSTSLYSVLSVKSILKDRIKAVILNRVPTEKLEEIKNQVIPTLSQRGIPMTTSIPEDPLLSFRSLREIREILDGEVLWGEENLSQPVGHMTAGSADLKSDLRVFKRVYNKIVLLQPFPLDEGFQESLAQRPVAGILLTGDRKPARLIIEAAKKAQIPLLLVKEDTFSALERLEQGPNLLSSKDDAKARHFAELMDRDGALQSLLQSLELTP